MPHGGHTIQSLTVQSCGIEGPRARETSVPGAKPRPDLDDVLCCALHSTARAAVRANKPALDQFGFTYPQCLVTEAAVGQCADPA